MENFAFCTFLLLALAIKATCRPLSYDPFELISDGIHDAGDEKSPFLLSRGTDYSSGECEQMYGFLPCSNGLLGHLFLILVYEYLLFHGESYVVSGGEQIFKILGPGVFGASAFHVLGFLPEALILLASGLLNSKEVAQEYVLTGVGLLAGSTILLLTVLWGICVIIGSQHFSNNLTSKSNPSASSVSRPNQITEFLSLLTDCGITTDKETSLTARIVVLSLIPFIIIQIPTVFHLSSSGEHVVILITLAMSFIFLLSYFIYQIFDPRIQKRRLEYVKHEHLVVDILNHVQKHTQSKLLTEDGAPNAPAIRRLFEEIDQDGNDFISFSELKQLLREIRSNRANLEEDKTIADIMNEFDCDDDNKITMDEFVNGFIKWLDETKLALNRRYHSVKSLRDLYQILQPWIHKKRKEHQMTKSLMSELIAHVQSSAMTSLYNDGIPDVPAIVRLFESIDLDKDNYISTSELKEVIINIKFGTIPWDADEAVAKIMEELDINGDKMINEEEFVSGFAKWLKISMNHSPNSTKSDEDDIYQKTWEETDLLVDERSIGRRFWAWTKAITSLLIGIVMLAVLAEPLIHSVQSFSNSASIPSFFISFVLVPLATNARGAISAISAARRKKLRTTSLTFSEIYDGVFMNNTLSFSVLLCLICFRGLSWHFSAEVLVVLIVGAIMGLAASLCSTFPVWTSFVAFLLYPLSLVLVYVLDDLSSWL